MKISRLKWIGPLVLLVLLALFGGLAECAKKSSGSSASPVKAAPPAPVAEDSSIIEEVSAKQLERLLQEKDYVAVYWCKCGRRSPEDPSIAISCKMWKKSAEENSENPPLI